MMLTPMRMTPAGKLLTRISSVLNPKEKNPQSERTSLNNIVTVSAEAKALPSFDLCFMLCSTEGRIATTP